MSNLEKYLTDLSLTQRTGEAVKETSFYPALANLLNAVGAGLKPKVNVVINTRNRGAGLPDGGFFTATQLKRLGGDAAVREPAAFRGQTPERGALEVKGAKEDVRAVAAGAQVARYLAHYGQVLVTNLREFLLVGRDAEGAAQLLESYALAESEAEFWRRAAQPSELAREHEGRLEEYLRRVMLSRAPLDAPEALAWFLASYARDARERISREDVALRSLRNVREALEGALGLRFEGEQGERFFRSTLVQTLFYGVFSAWVLWAKTAHDRRARFDWRMAQWTLRVPAIRTLFEQVVTPTNVRGLGLEEILNWTADTLNRVEREKFFARFEQTQAVQYFYEPFLEAFDPELRKQLGVWYTPQEIVRYMVERTDTVLREELGLERGLADERVYVLDPCCGTGAYLVETLRRIKRTIDEAGGDALGANDLKEAATRRVFGFEILPAPFVVAHLQLGLLLQSEGSPLAEGERVGVYLTNALTGWEPPAEPKKQLPFAFHALEEERDAAEQVKRATPILVVIGNPPYNGFAGTSPAEEQGLVEPYKEGLRDWGITKNYLDDLYVRFFRLAERRITEMSGKGVVCFISNFSYLGNQTFVVMRKRFTQEFDAMWFDSLNGDSRETGKLTPEGKPDPSVFSTPHNREGIRVGTAIALLVRKEERGKSPMVRFRQFWGATKRSDLLESLNVEDFNSKYAIVSPNESHRFSFRPSAVNEGYDSWPDISSLSEIKPLLGLNDNRGQATHEIRKAEILERMRAYYDPVISFEEMRMISSGLTTDAASFNAQSTRERLQNESGFDEKNVRRFWFKPFDLRWAYVERNANLWNRIRPELIDQAWEDNSFILARCHAPKAPDGATLYFSKHISDQHILHTDAYFIPLRLRMKQSLKEGVSQKQFFAETETVSEDWRANLSATARAYLAALGVVNIDADKDAAALVWMHALAIGYAPAYLAENADGIRADFPRVPLPATRELLEQSAALGRQVAALLDTETPVSGVTTGHTRPELRHVANIRRRDGAGALNPSAGDLELRAGWGHRGKGGVVMPGKGRLAARDYAATERAEMDARAHAAFGSETRDVFLNDTALWANIPARVWDYTIGGYQVLKKWLSYREFDVLGRALTPTEAREVTHTARRLAALLLLEQQLDENYARVKADSHDWPRDTSA